MTNQTDPTPIFAMADADALTLVHPDDQQRVLKVHAKLPGQSLASTVHNTLYYGIVRRIDEVR